MQKLSRLIVLSCLLATLMIPGVNAQVASSIRLFNLNTDSFPHVRAQLQAYDGNGNFIHGLSAEEVEILEDGQAVPLDSLEELITTEWAMPGLGDAGAHVSQMIDSGWSTFILSHWHRDSGVYSLEEAVRRISAVPAGVLGLEDRGVLAVGKRADVNVLDLSRLEERMPEIVNDFPFGAPRFIQRAAGYKATLCNGDFVLRDDELTGAQPGRVLRSN